MRPHSKTNASYLSFATWMCRISELNSVRAAWTSLYTFHKSFPVNPFYIFVFTSGQSKILLGTRTCLALPAAVSDENSLSFVPAALLHRGMTWILRLCFFFVFFLLEAEGVGLRLSFSPPCRMQGVDCLKSRLCSKFWNWGHHLKYNFPVWQHKNVFGKHQRFQFETRAIDALSATSGPCIYCHHSDEFGCPLSFISNLWSKSVILKCVRALRGWNTPRQLWNECTEESYRGKQAAIVKNKWGSIGGGRVAADDVEPSSTNPTAQSKQMHWGLKRLQITNQDAPDI